MFQVQSSGIHEAILVFNLLPATYVDPSWIDAPPVWRTRLAQLQSTGGQRALSDWLLAQHHLAGCYDFDFSPLEKALFLQGPLELQRLAAVIGVVRHRESLRRMIGGGTLARLGKELGAELLDKGLVRLPPMDWIVAPDSGIDRDAERLLPQLLASGTPWLLGVLQPSWRAVAARARLKFPRELASRPPLVLQDSARSKSIEYLKKHFLSEGTLWT
jgi:hypothetical protein